VTIFQLNFFAQNEDILISVRIYTIKVLTSNSVGTVIPDRLTFLWFVDTCKLGHLARCPQEALRKTVKY
jgi:hypothetical protein